MSNCKKNILTKKSGIGYLIPFEIKEYKIKKWELHFQTHEEFGVDIQHFDWWQNELAELLIETLQLDVDLNTLNDFKLRYTGIPRFRDESIRGIYNIYHGGNLTMDMKSLISLYFNNEIIKYVFDDHETYSHDDKEVAQFVLNISENAY